VIPLKAPKYKSARFDEKVGLPEDIEHLSKELKKSETTVTKTDLAE